MTITAKALANAQYAPSSTTTIYTAPIGGRAIIDKFTATNTDASAITLSVYLVPLGQSAGGTYQVVKDFSIAAGVAHDFSELQNQILNSGDFIAVIASTASKLVVRPSGREIT